MSFHSALIADKYTGGKTPFSAFFLLYRSHSTANSWVSVEWSPFFCISEQKLKSQESKSLKQLWVNCTGYHLQNKQKIESPYLVNGIEYKQQYFFHIFNTAAPTTAGSRWKNIENRTNCHTWLKLPAVRSSTSQPSNWIFKALCNYFRSKLQLHLQSICSSYSFVLLPLITPLDMPAGCKPTTGSTHQHPVELLFKINITRTANFSKTSSSQKLAPTWYVY